MSYPTLYNTMVCVDDLVEKYRPAIAQMLGCGTTAFSLWHVENRCEWNVKLTVGTFELRYGTIPTQGGQPEMPNVIARFRLYPMINCCGICVSTEAMVQEGYRGRGLGTLLNNLRIDIARYLGYGLLMCTDVVTNTYQRKVLAHNGWRDVWRFVNPRTTNTVAVSVINL